MTKEQQKVEANKVYRAIIDPHYEAYEAIADSAWKAYEAIADSAYKAYEAIIDPALKDYEAKCKEIDEQKDVIKIIDGKRYKLIEE